MIIELKAFKVKDTGELYGWHQGDKWQPENQNATWTRLAESRKDAKTLIVDNQIIVEYDDELIIYTKIL